MTFRRAVLPTLLLAACCAVAVAQEDAGNGWRSLFNGRDLDGWTIKVTGHELGENYADTLSVEDGVMKISYHGYDDFDGQFTHVFYREPFSNYILRIEYRFVGEQCKGGPGWAFRNSGVMLHSPPPEKMKKDQSFPVSIEAQMLGGDGTNERTTANVCTPGTNIVMDGKLITQHCTNSTSKTYHGDQWVTMDLEVHGNGVIRHWLEGEVVLEYEQPQLDPNDGDAKELIGDDGDLMLDGGYFSIQGESHPLEVRRVLLLPLDE